MKTTLAIIFSFTALVFSTITMTGLLEKKKIAYVRSSELVYGYAGMKEAQEKYRQKAQAWQMNIDTLKKNYQLSLSDYTMNASRLSVKDRETRQQILQKQQDDIINYSNAISEKAKTEDDEITQSVLNQINSFVEQYGKEHGYEVIFGTTISGNILYGEQAMDITEEVLAGLNNNYKGIQREN